MADKTTTAKTKDGRVICMRCGCVAVLTSAGRWICGGTCSNV